MGSEELQAPCRQDLLLFLCAHGAKHAWNRLKWITDIAELLRVSPDLDWRALMGNVDAWGAERLLLLGDRLAHDLLSAQLPDEMLARIADEPVLEPLAALVAERLWKSLERSPGILENASFHLKMRTRWQDKLRYCLQNTMVPTVGEWKLIPLPEHLSFLYYPMRPLRLIGAYSLGLLKRLFTLP